MKIPSVLQNLLTNKIVLNIVSVLTALNMIGYLVTGKIIAILFFIVLAILITHFSKNMIIVLGIPLILVNLFVANGLTYIEGMETNSDSKNTDSNNTDSDKKMSTEHKDTIKKINTQNKTTTQGSPMTPLEPTVDTNESFEVGRAKRRGAGPQIDYASTVEDAYDNLNSILGGEGIQKLTADSQKLMKQQMELAKSMKAIEPMVASLEPMMVQAQEMMKGMGEGNTGMQGLMEMAQKMGIGGKKQ